MNITIGADPELFVQRDNQIISAIGMIGGSKNFPRLVPQGAVQEDNVLAEFNIDPAETVEEFLGNISTVTSELAAIVYPCTLKVQSSHEFTREVLLEGGDQALTFGCDPDLDCWSVEMNKSPDALTTLRTAGGHVHIGYDGANMDKSLRVARMAEFLLGVPSVLLDDDKRRRSLYGASGAIRLKAYGVEYRVLSNFWLGSDELKAWVFEQARRCVEQEGMLESSLDLFPEAVVRSCIDNSDEELARVIVQDLMIPMPSSYVL